MTPEELAAELFKKRSELLEHRITGMLQANLTIMNEDTRLANLGIPAEIRLPTALLALGLMTRTIADQMQKEEAAKNRSA